MPEERCNDCPNVNERREYDQRFKENIIRELAGLSESVLGLKESVVLWRSEIIEQRGDIKKITWRVAFLAGGCGIVGGIISALVSIHLKAG
jgi:hypothetical protein